MRVKTGKTRRRRHKKILKSTKGYRLSYSKNYTRAHEAYMHAGQYSRKHRRKRGGQFRRLWITRISAALESYDISYSAFMKALSDRQINLNRKVLAQLAVNEPEIFSKVVNLATK